MDFIGTNLYLISLVAPCVLAICSLPKDYIATYKLLVLRKKLCSLFLFTL